MRPTLRRDFLLHLWKIERRFLDSRASIIRLLYLFVLFVNGGFCNKASRALGTKSHPLEEELGTQPVGQKERC